MPPGWITYARDTFPNAGEHWSASGEAWDGTFTASSECGSYGYILGGYGVFGTLSWAKRTFDNLTPHDAVRVTFRFVKVDRWTNAHGGRRAQMAVDDNILWTHTFSNEEADRAECGRPGPHPSNRVYWEQRVGGDTDPFPHTSTSLTIRFSTAPAEGQQSLVFDSHQHWGIQDVAVHLFTFGAFPPLPPSMPPEPPPPPHQPPMPPMHMCTDLACEFEDSCCAPIGEVVGSCTDGLEAVSIASGLCGPERDRRHYTCCDPHAPPPSPLSPGWLEVSHTHFPDTDTAGWVTVPADAPTTVCNSLCLGGFGEFGRLAHATRTYTGLYPHEAVRLRFTSCASTLDQRVGARVRRWPAPLGEADVEGDDDGEHVCGDDGRDAIIDELVQHSSPNLTLHITSTLNEAPDDESWGIQDAPSCPFYTGFHLGRHASAHDAPPLVIESQLPPSPPHAPAQTPDDEPSCSEYNRDLCRPRRAGAKGASSRARSWAPSACSLLASRAWCAQSGGISGPACARHRPRQVGRRRGVTNAVHERSGKVHAPATPYVQATEVSSSEVLSYREDRSQCSPQHCTQQPWRKITKGRGSLPFDSARRVCFLVLNAALFELRECMIRDIEASCSTIFQNMLYIRTLYYACARTLDLLSRFRLFLLGFAGELLEAPIAGVSLSAAGASSDAFSAFASVAPTFVRASVAAAPGVGSDAHAGSFGLGDFGVCCSSLPPPAAAAPAR